MKPRKHLNWILPVGITYDSIYTALSTAFRVESAKTNSFQRAWFDTFDWRLFNKKLLLVKESNKWVLYSLSGKILQTLTDQTQTFRFQNQFPDSSFRDGIKNVLGIRSLVTLGEENIHSSIIRILNMDHEIVGIVDVHKSEISGIVQPQLTVLMHGIKGHPKYFKRAVSAIQDLGGNKQNDFVEPLQRILRIKDCKHLDYRSKFSISLQGQMSGAEAVSLINTALVQNIRQNRRGVIDDIDTEFLHDLRVAVRRTRSGLALIKNVVEKTQAKRFKQEFKYVGTMTGAVRDLDVYLLSNRKYKALLPHHLQTGVDYFFQELGAQRDEEQKKLVHFLKSRRYAKIIDDWEQLFVPDATFPGGGNQSVPIAELANKIIYKHFKRVVRDGKKINRNSKDAALHRLRIQCKKLRYSIEFFESLYPTKDVKILVKQLKKLQNNLGDFNDLSVQQEMLSEYLNSIHVTNSKSREIAASIGGLLVALANQHLEVRSQFEKKFNAFSVNKNCEVYLKLFGQSDAGPNRFP